MTEQKREYYRKYYAKNKEAINERNKKWYKEHKEQVLAIAKKYRENHPEAHAEWQRKNKDKLKAIRTRYRKKVALHKKRVKQAKFQCRDEKGRFCKWEDKPLNYLPALRLLTAIALYK